jgi:uncharacterized protein (TIGR02594 family)
MADTVFPAIIKAVYQDGNAFAELKRAASDAGAGAAAELERHFKGSADVVSKAFENALSRPMTKAGALDLGVDQMRAGVAAAEAQAAAYRTAADAAATLSTRQSELSAVTQVYLARTLQAADAADRDVTKKREQLSVFEALQAEMNSSARVAALAGGANLRLSGTHDALAHSSGSARIAQFELMHVVRASADAFAAGAPPMQIMAMEIGRLGEAAAFSGGSLGAVGRFMASGWGIGVMAAASVLGIFIAKLVAAAEEADKTAERMGKLVTAADTVSAAQGTLGKVMDLVTGQFDSHNIVLRETIRLQAILAAQNAHKEVQAAGKALQGMGPAAFLDPKGRPVADADVAGFGNEFGSGARDMGLTANVNATAAFQNLVRGFLTNRNASPVDFRRQLERMQAAGHLPGLDVSKAMEQVLNVSVGRGTIAENNVIRDIIDGKARLPDDWRKDPKKVRDHSGQIDRLEGYSDEARSRVEGIEGRFADTPKIAQQAAAALNQLGLVQDEIGLKDRELKKLGVDGGLKDYAKLMALVGQAKENVKDGEIRLLGKDFEEAPKAFQKAAENLAELDRLTVQNAGNQHRLAEIAQTRATIETGLLRPLRDYLTASERQAQIQGELNAGHEQEAAFLQAKFALMDRLGAKDEEQLRRTLELGHFHGDINALLREQVEHQHQLALGAEKWREALQPALDAIQSARDATRQIIEDVLGGKGPKSLADFGKNIVAGFNRSLSAQLTENLFGNAFRQLRDQVTGWDDPLKKATGAAAAEMDQTRAALAQLTQHVTSTTPPIDAFSGTVGTATSALDRFTGALGGAAAAAGGDGGAVTGGPTAANVLATAGSYVGATESGSKGLLEKLFSGAGIHIDPEKTAWCAAFVNAVLGANGIKGTGSLAASSFLKYGTATNNPQPGDIAVFAHHVGFLAGFKANGNPRIIGGNQGPNGAVLNEGFSAGDVIAYRHIPGLADAVKKLDPVAQATSDRIKALNAAVAALGDTASNAAQKMGQDIAGLQGPGAAPGVAVANDNLSALDTTASTLAGTLGGLNDEASKSGDALQKVGDSLAQVAEDIVVTATKKKGGAGFVADGANLFQLYEKMGGSMGASLGKLLGNAKMGESIGGAIGQAIPYIAIAQAVQGTVEKIFGIKHNPLGDVFGLLGDFVGNALWFNKPKQAGSSFGVDAFGNITVAAGKGDKASGQTAVQEANSVSSAIQGIVKQLGASLVGSALSGVTLGYRASDKNQPFRVDTTGAGRATGNGVLAFATEQEAVSKAIQLMIQRGVIGGISAASQKILQSGQDLQTALEKATLIESVPKQLKALKDPVGAALDELNGKFKTLVSALQEGGATAEQMAQAEELYDLQRKQAVEEAGKAMTSAFKGLLDDLTINNDAFSLRDRLAAARAKFDPLEAQIKGGDYSHAQDFADAGKAVEAIMRLLNGSQSAYFDFVKALVDETTTALNGQQAKVDAASGVASPFGAPPIDTTPAIEKVAGILSNTIAGQLQAVNDNLGRLIAQGYSTRDDTPLVGMRNF